MAIIEVDGKELGGYWAGPPPRDIYLLPGPHRIKVSYWHHPLTADGVVTFTAVPGTEYLVHTKAQGYDLRFWLTNGKGDVEPTAKWERVN